MMISNKSAKTKTWIAGTLLSASLLVPSVVHADYAGMAVTHKSVRGHDTQLVYVNLNDSAIQVEAVSASGKVGATESLAGIAKDNNALAAINGGFFNSYSDGQPLTVVKTDGAFEHNGSFGAAIGITDANKTMFGRLYPTITGSTNGNKSWYAWGINHYYNTEGAITILTPAVKKRALSGGKTVVVSGGSVKQITTGDAAIPSDGYIIHFGNDVVKTADVFHIGDKVDYTINYADDSNNWDQASNIMGGGPLLVKNGQVVVDPKTEKFTDPKQISPDIRSIRSFIGVTKDNRLVMGTASGVSIYELADVVHDLGLINAVGMDSGASSGLYANGSYLTSPGRDLADALVVKLRPKLNYDLYVNGKYLKSYSSTTSAINAGQASEHAMVKDKSSGNDLWDNYASQVYQHGKYINDFGSRKAAMNFAKKYDHASVYDVDSKTNVWSNYPLTVLIDNKEQSYDQPPVGVSGRVLVPMRGIFETLGYTVAWDQDTQNITATKGDQKIVMKIGSKTVQVNGVTQTLDVPSMVIHDRTLVPIRFIAEASGDDVQWNQTMQSVYITTTK